MVDLDHTVVSIRFSGKLLARYVGVPPGVGAQNVNMSLREPWFISTTHEHDCWLDLTDEEYAQIREIDPELYEILRDD
jgi:hypothetical protein